MRFCLIGPGKLPIPPVGWGAIEILIWDYKCELERLGHEVVIVNTKDREAVVREANDCRPDFVHLHWEYNVDLLERVDCPAKATTGHYRHFPRVTPRSPKFAPVLRGYRKSSGYAFCLSPAIRDRLVRYGCRPDRCFVTPNGARKDLFRFAPSPRFPDRSICLGLIQASKRQSQLQRHEAGVVFVGGIADRHQTPGMPFDTNDPNYLGTWTKEQVYDGLTDYANLVLLSDGEAHSLAVVEALMAGIGLVVAEGAAANLDLSKPFIDVVPESRVDDGEYVREVIARNREKSLRQREAIRQYAVDQFDWSGLVQRYVGLVERLVREPVAAPSSFGNMVRDAGELLVYRVPRGLKHRFDEWTAWALRPGRINEAAKS